MPVESVGCLLQPLHEVREIASKWAGVTGTLDRAAGVGHLVAQMEP